MKIRFFTLLLCMLGTLTLSLAQETTEPVGFPRARCHYFEVEAPSSVYVDCTLRIDLNQEGISFVNYHYTLTGPGLPPSSAQFIPLLNTIYVTPTVPSTPGNPHRFILTIYKSSSEGFALCQILPFYVEVLPKIEVVDIEVVQTENQTIQHEVCCGSTRNFTYNEQECLGEELSAGLQLTLLPDILSVEIGASVNHQLCIQHGVENSCTAPENECIYLYETYVRKDIKITYNELDCDGNVISLNEEYLDNVLTSVSATCSPLSHEPDCSEFDLEIDFTHPEYFFHNGSISINPVGGSGTYEYFWDNPNIEGTGADGLASGTYCVTVYDVVKCCTLVRCIELIDCDLDVEFYTYVDYGNGIGITAGEIGGTPDYTFEWENGETGPYLTVIFEGTYCVTVTDDIGCTTEDCYEAYCNGMSVDYWVSESYEQGYFDITINQVINNDDRQVVCDWTSEFGEPLDGDCYSLEHVPAGMYTLTLWDGLCYHYEYIYIEYECPLEVTLTETAWGEACVNVDGGSGDYFVQWFFLDCYDGSIIYTEAGDNLFCVNFSGPYQICVDVLDNHVDGCAGIASDCIWVDCFGSAPDNSIAINPGTGQVIDRKKEENASLPAGQLPGFNLPAETLSSDAPSAFKAFPNPFDYEINIAFYAELEEALNIELLDMLGRVIETEQANAIQGQNNYRFTLETPISEGIYFLRVTSDKGEIHWTNKMLYKNTRP